MQVYPEKVTNEWIFQILSENKSNYDLPTYLGCLPELNGFYFLRKNGNLKDYTRDGWVWHQSSKYKIKGFEIMRVYKYVMFGYPKKVASRSFSKVEHFLLDDSSIVLIMYLGDSSIVPRQPHGNSKQPEPFNSTLPSTLEKIRNDHCYGPVQPT